MPTLFSKIVTGEIPCHKVGETDDFLAFLDIMPVAPGLIGSHDRSLGLLLARVMTAVS